jgi:hypothetical protein
MAVLLLIGVVFVVALVVFMSLNRRKVEKLQATASVMQDFAQRNGMRFGRFEPNLPARAPTINELVGAVHILVDFQLDGTMAGVPFQAFQVRRPPPRSSGVTFDASTRTPEFSAVLVPRPVPGPPLQLAPQGLSWSTALRRDVVVGDPAFDAAFHVSTDTPAFAQHLLRPPLTTWLAADPTARGVVVVFEPSALMVFTGGALTPEGAMALSGLAANLHHQVPWHALGG